MAKRYYWLKLKEDFFDKKLIKKLRSVAGGDTYTIIYLKMQLKSINNEGILTYEGIEDTFAEELALDIDEDVENVKMTLAYLQRYNMIEQVSSENFLLNEVLDCIGSETDSAERKREQRKRESERKALESGQMSTLCPPKCDNVTTESRTSHIEKDIDRDKTRKEKDFSSEFEELWKLYPRKEGKQVALRVYNTCRKNNETTFEEVKQGILNYIKQIEKNKTQYQYIQHGSTWFNQKRWTDVYEIPTTKKIEEQEISEEKRNLMSLLAED